MSKHTPGPWVFDYDNGIIAAVGAHICTVCMADEFPCIDDDEGNERTNVDIECKANAHLIAAAPEMLDTIKWLRGNYAGGSTMEINARIADAIAKAEGIQ